MSIEKNGWQVAKADNGEQALKQLEHLTPDLILSDLMMPVMDGFEFIENLRQHPQWQNIPVVVLTAKDISADEQKRLQISVTQVLQKGTYKREELLNEVRMALMTAHYET